MVSERAENTEFGQATATSQRSKERARKGGEAGDIEAHYRLAISSYNTGVRLEKDGQRCRLSPPASATLSMEQQKRCR